MSFNNYGPAIKALQADCAWKLSHVRVAYRDGDGHSAGRPAQRYTDVQGRVRYRPWSGPIGGAWPRKQSAADRSPSKEQP